MFDDSRLSIPEAFATMTPGPVLSAFVSTVDRTRMNGHDLVNLMKAQARLVAYAQAELAATIREVAYCPYGDATSPAERAEHPDEYAADEIRAALNLTRRAAELQLSSALALIETLPEVWKALHKGDIDIRRATVIADCTGHLPSGTAQEIAAKVMERAPQQTTGEIAARLRRLCIDHNPDDAARRYDKSVYDRRLTTEQNPEGTANILGYQLPPHEVYAAKRRIDRLARQMRTPEEVRTMDQIRADVFLDLLNGNGRPDETPGVSATANITVDLTTLSGLDDRAGELPGMGPVIADIARQTAVQAKTWSYSVTDPATGDIVATGTTRRRPTTGQIKNVRATNPTCVFPGCRMPAVDCDLDHTIDYANGGPTTEDNLGPACRHDHNVKHKGKWMVERLPDGRFQWVSRLGHRYTTERGRSP